MKAAITVLRNRGWLIPFGGNIFDPVVLPRQPSPLFGGNGSPDGRCGSLAPDYLNLWGFSAILVDGGLPADEFKDGLLRIVAAVSHQRPALRRIYIGGIFCGWVFWVVALRGWWRSGEF